MKISERTISAIGQIITGDKKLSAYRSGQNLVRFFNEFGFNNIYGEGFPSRWKFAEDCIRLANNETRLKSIIEAALDPREYLDTEFILEKAIEYINQWLRYDGYEVINQGGLSQIRSLGAGTIDMDIGDLNFANDGHQFIDEQLKKSEEKVLSGDYDGAITNARSLIEAVLTHIEAQHSAACDYDGDLIKLYKRVQNLLNLTPSNTAIDNSLKQVLTGLTSIVNGVASLSNKMGDRHVRTYKPAKHHAKLVVNSARVLVNFLFDTQSHQREMKN